MCGSLLEGTLMISRTKRTQLAAVSLVAVAALGLAACSSNSKASNGGSTSGAAAPSSNGGSSSGGGSQPVTLTWWHNANNDPGKSAFQKVADDYHAAHPNVTFKVQPIQNEDIKTKIPIALQGTPPDIFQQ